MVHIPKVVSDSPLSRKLNRRLKRLSAGKVRETYELSDGNLLVVATDRISIFDFILGCLIAGKGEILTAITAFWLRGPLCQFKNHLIAAGAAIDEYLPRPLRNDPELQKRALVVRRLEMAPIEAIVRDYLTGSGLDAYLTDNGMVCGIQLPAGLHDGSKLEEPIFTPTDKATEGHDKHIPREVVRERFPWMEALVLQQFRVASAHLATKGYVLADTKTEYGTDGTLGDETYTPDSSRIFRLADYAEAQQRGKMPSSFDKQPVRNYGLSLVTGFGLPFNKLSPENDDHLAFADSVVLPQDITEQTIDRYRTICQVITGMPLEQYQTDVLRISL